LSKQEKKLDELIKLISDSSDYDAILVSDLTAALTAGDGVKKEKLIELLESEHVPVRVAALEAARGRNDGQLISKLIRMVEDREPRVRRKLAEILPSLPQKRLVRTLETLLDDDDEYVVIEALRATHGNMEFLDTQRDKLVFAHSNRVRMAAAEALKSLNQQEITLVYFIEGFANGCDEVLMHCGEILEDTLSELGDKADSLACPFVVAEKALGKFVDVDEAAKTKPYLIKFLKARQVKPPNLDELAKYGTNLTALADKQTLPRAYGIEDVRDKVLEVLKRDGQKAIVLLGETGVGKSAIVNELVYELDKAENGGWLVLRVSPSEFMVGTKYLGEWETRVNNLVKEVKKPCRVILYIPNLGELAGMGRWSQSSANVGTALAPHIEDGSIVVIGESTPQEYAMGVGATPALNRLFDKFLVEPASNRLTLQILARVRDDAKCEISDDVLEGLLDVSDQYLSNSARPGNAVSLLRDVVAGHANSSEPVTSRTVLDAVSKSTGIPSDFLDDSIPLDLGDVRAFFEKRIMGQPEAVESVVDLLTLIKAGVTDQNKPFGVLLFVGPTGVGKTELARALAEYVFGDVNRLQRFDMSEFASYEGYERLFGASGQTGILTEAVRQKPFSVILLDEIEKGHTNVFDLCLQMFDAGRLTDGQGRTVDFCRTIVIITSNVGATGPETTLGFGANGSNQRAGSEQNKERTMRQLSRVFRPEFLNRIDRIVNFRALSLQVAESIARREVDAVLKRSGITRRHLSVDIDPSVVSVLLKEGYSQSYGARPLKRAVEKMLLLPIAKAIATGKISGRMVLRLTTSGNKIDVKVISAGEAQDAPAQRKAEKQAVRNGNSLRDLSQELVDGIAALEDHIIPMSDRKSELLHEIHKPDFYQNHEAKTKTFDEIHKIDQFLATYEGLCKVVSGIHDRLAKPVSRSEEPDLLERINQVGAELEHLSFIATCSEPRDMGDALVCVRLVDRNGENVGGIDTLVKMYIAFAQKRRLTVDVVSECMSDKEESVFIHVVGLGAYALLKNEAGLHQFDNRYKSRNGKDKDKARADREVIRVDVLALDAEPDKAFRSKLKTAVSPAKAKSGLFLKKPTYEISLFHEPSIRSLRGLFVGDKTEAVGCAEMVIFAMVNNQDESALDYIVRYYDFGTGAKIKDARSGKVTGRIDQILKGNLDLFIQPIYD